MNPLTIYHNQALLGFAEVVNGNDLALPGPGGGLIRGLGLSEIVSYEADATSLVALHVQEHRRSRLNLGVPNDGIFDLVQDNSRKLCCRRSA